VKVFFLPSLASIFLTFLALRWISRRELKGKAEDAVEAKTLSSESRRAARGMVLFGAVLISASLLGMDLGLPTLLAGVAAVAIAMRGRGKSMAAIAGAVSWSVLPMVAGLFVLVDALRVAGALYGVDRALHAFSRLPAFAGRSPHLSASRFYRTS